MELTISKNDSGCTHSHTHTYPSEQTFSIHRQDVQYTQLPGVQCKLLGHTIFAVTHSRQAQSSLSKPCVSKGHYQAFSRTNQQGTALQRL